MEENKNNQEENNQNNNSNNNTGIILGLVFIIVILIAFIIVSFDFSKKRIINLKNRNKRLIAYIRKVEDELYPKLETYFKLTYFIFKLIVLSFFILLYVLLYMYSKYDCFYSYLGNCSNVTSSIGFTIILICFLLDKNPLNYFEYRDNIKELIKNWFYKRHESKTQKLIDYKLELETNIKTIEELQGTSDNE